jgi:hypothetical protein
MYFRLAVDPNPDTDVMQVLIARFHFTLTAVPYLCQQQC